MKSYTHFTLTERECLSEKIKEGKGIREIAREMGRSPSTISREIKRNYSKCAKQYHPWRATILYITRRKRCVRKHVISKDPELEAFIVECLQKYWSPEIIAAKCKEQNMQIACATIYRAIREKRLPGITEQEHLRRRGKLKYKHGAVCNTIHPDRTIHERPAIVETKERIGDWEGDTVYGAKGKGCIVTLVERKSKVFAAARSANREAENVRKAFVHAFQLLGFSLPIETITLDNGSEFAKFRDIETDLDTKIYFADPHAPWQRGLNENTNDMIRFFFPKGTDFHKVTDEELQAVVSLINNRPRKTLGFLSPLEFISKKCCT